VMDWSRGGTVSEPIKTLETERRLAAILGEREG